MTTLDDLDPEDAAWARNWIRHSQGDWGAEGDGSPKRLRYELDLQRERRPISYRWLVTNVPQATTIASRSHWLDPQPTRHAPTDAEIAAVEASVAAAIAAVMRAAQPQDPDRDRSQQLDAITGLPLRPRYLSPEQLDALNPLPDGRKRAQQAASERATGQLMADQVVG